MMSVLACLLALVTGSVLGALTVAPGATAREVAESPGDAQRPVADATAAPSIAGVAELRRLGESGETMDAFAYSLLTSQDAFDWPVGTGSGNTDSGVALLSFARLAKSTTVDGSTTTLAVANLVGRPGFTDFVIVVYDQNGMLDYVCEKLNEKQVEFINLGTWGYINPGWVGSAIVSATFWEHDVFGDLGAFERNLVGLAGVSFDSRTDRGGASGDSATGSVGSPLMSALGPAYGPDRSGWRYLCPSGPSLPRQPVPTPGSPTQTPTPTPKASPTATTTPPVPPPYAPGSPEINLPALGQARVDNECWATIRVQNVGREPAQALAVVWGGASECGPGCEGPSKVVCTGLLKPGSTWEITPLTLSAPARSAAVFSFTGKLLSEIGADLTTGLQDEPVADYMCTAVPEQVLDSCDGYLTWKHAYDSGGSWQGVPMAGALGAPLVVQVHRSCEYPTGIDLAAESSYEGASGIDLGYAAPGERYSYSLPHIAALDETRSSIVHLQNAGDTCASVALATYYTSPASSRCGTPVACEVAPIAPGESVSVDISDCRSPGFEGSGLVESDVPLAIVVDDPSQTTLASYTVRPTSLREMHGEPVLGTAGDVAFVPLLVKNYQGWTSRLFVQGLGPGETTLKVTLTDRSGDVVSQGWFGPLCAFDAVTIDLETMPGVPYSWIGSARIEAYASVPPEATPWVPAPTSTAAGSVGPTATATPCSGTCPPSSTPTPGLPTATPAAATTTPPGDAPRPSAGILYLPVAAKLDPVARCPGAMSRESAEERAIGYATGLGMRPPPGSDRILVRDASLLTAAEADERYGFALTSHYPPLDPEYSVWYFDLDVRGLVHSGDRPPWLATRLILVLGAVDGWCHVQLSLGPPEEETPEATATLGSEPATTTPVP